MYNFRCVVTVGEDEYEFFCEAKGWADAEEQAQAAYPNGVIDSIQWLRPADAAPEKPAKMLRLRLQLDVEYDITQTDQGEADELYLIGCLDSIGSYASSEGLLSRDSPAWVESWRSSVTKLED